MSTSRRTKSESKRMLLSNSAIVSQVLAPIVFSITGGGPCRFPAPRHSRRLRERVLLKRGKTDHFPFAAAAERSESNSRSIGGDSAGFEESAWRSKRGGGLRCCRWKQSSCPTSDWYLAEWGQKGRKRRRGITGSDWEIKGTVNR